MGGPVESMAGRLAAAVASGDRDSVTRLLRATEPVALPQVLLQTVVRATAQVAAKRQAAVDAAAKSAGRNP